MQKLETPKAAEMKRPTSANVLLWVLGFLGVTALGGGIEMLVFPRGNAYLPVGLLDPVPFLDTFVVPGLVLAGVFGVGSLLVVWGMATRRELAAPDWIRARTGRHWSWAGAVALGIAFTLWMVIEIALLGWPTAADTTEDFVTTLTLYSLYGSVAVLLLILPHLHGVRTYLTGTTRGRTPH